MVERAFAKSVKAKEPENTERRKNRASIRIMTTRLLGCSAQQWKILMSKYIYKVTVHKCGPELSLSDSCFCALRLLWYYLKHSNLKQMKNYRPLSTSKEKPIYYHLNPLLYAMVPKTVCKLNIFTNQIEHVRELQPNRLYEY